MLQRWQEQIEAIKTKINILILKRRIIRNNLKIATSSANGNGNGNGNTRTVLEETVSIIGEVF